MILRNGGSRRWSSSANRLPIFSNTLNPSEVDSTQTGGVPAAEPVDDNLSFLSPAQKPDELGRLGGYRVLRLLGQGGMGIVLEAEDIRLKRRLALKVMKPEIAVKEQHRQRFLREAQAAAHVEHDHIVPIYQIGEENGVPFIAMPFLKGEPLDARLRKSRLEVPEIITIARQTAEGLAAAHKHGLVHRDIKPANIWLEATDSGGFRVKILDFGLACNSGDDTNLTRSGTIVGTPAYMAPEQARGYEVDQRADQFSLGCILYEMSTGKRPFSGDDPMAILTSLALDVPREPIRLNASLPPSLSQITMKLLEKEPGRRFRNCREVAVELKKLMPDNTVVVEVERQPAVSLWDDLDADDTEVVPFSEKRTEWEAEKPSDRKRMEREGRDSKGRGGKSKKAMLLGGGVGFLVVVIVATVLFFVNKKNEKSDLPKKEMASLGKQDGVGKVTDTEKKKATVITDTEKKKATVITDTEKKNTPVAVDPDRKAANYVLSIGSGVRIDGEDRDRKGENVLPNGAFQLTSVNLGWNPQVTDASLANLKDCKNLTVLILGPTTITDAGLVHFKDCKNLTTLSLNACVDVTDTGLIHFKDCKNLTNLNLFETKLTNAGLNHFKDCTSLTELNLGRTRVSDVGLPLLKGLTSLENLQLTEMSVTDKGLAVFKDCKNLTVLNLHGCRKVTDAALAVFKDCKNLTRIELGSTQVGDQGLDHLKDCKNLTVLNLHGCRNVTDAALAVFKDCKNLTRIELGSTQVGDQGLAHLKDCKNLTRLDLEGTQVGDVGLVHLAGLDKLVTLNLTKTKVTAKGVEGLEKALPNCQITWDSK